MGNYSEISLAGTLAFDPDVRALPSGTTLTKLVIPTHRKYETKGNWVEETTWHRISVFGGAGDACAKYLQKGSIVRVRGRLAPDPETGNPRIWTDKNGETKASYDITAEQVDFLANIKSASQVEDDYVPGFEEDEW